MLDHDYAPFDDDTPGNEPPGAVVDYDPFDDDESGAAGVDFTYYDSLEFISLEPGAGSRFGAIIEDAAQKCPARRSEIVEFIYNEMPALAALDVAHSQGVGLHELDARARALGYGWNWSEDKNRIGRRTRAGFDGKPRARTEIITRAQAAAVDSDTPAVVATPAPVKVIAPPREIIKPAPRKFKKLVTVNNAGRVVKDKSTFPDRKIISDPMPARGDYKTPPAADNDASGVPEMFQEWMKSRGKVSYHKGHTATKLPAYLLRKSS